MGIPRQRILSLTLSLLLVVVTGPLVVAAQDEPTVTIQSVETADFPTIRVNLSALDAEGNVLTQLPEIQLSEGGKAISDFESRELQTGVDLFFVIDANSSIDQRDAAGGSTRLEKTRDSIIRYAERFMTQTQLTRVSIIAPGAGGGDVLVERAIFTNAVINEINFYEPELVEETPLNEMLEQTLALAATDQVPGQFQAILLFTDGGQLADQLDFDGLVERAQETGVAIYSAILGARADPNEIENVTLLSEPTGATFVHMQEAEDTDELYQQLQNHGLLHQLEYRSTLNATGEQTISVVLGSSRATATVELTIEPPSIELKIDNTQPIRRVVEEADAPLSAAEPSSQPVVAQVTWVDEHPRSLTEVTLLVDQDEQEALSTPVLDADGLLSFDWNIAELDQGTYDLAVRVVDELGLEGQSSPLPISIELEQPAAEIAPTSAPEVEPTAESGFSLSEETQVPTETLGIAGFVFGGLALVGAAFLVLLAAVIVRRRRVQPAPVAAPALSQAQHDETQVIMPGFVVQRTGGAFLEAIENAPEHKDVIPLSDDNTTIGRDPNLAKVVFADKSVSRLHARIMERNGDFQLYDEGSASGTYINYERISLTPQTLNDNDDVHIGRVHLRFRLAEADQDSDSTQVMAAPPRPGTERQPVTDSADDDGLGTQPYMPHQPQAPRQAPAGPEPDDDADDVSTQPYMPHEPKR